ncbi:MAG: hypothetical protein JO147_15305 [Actinobacteria bacterium]|nr:hypothetical protein [Actinomycetota bacterium]
MSQLPTPLRAALGLVATVIQDGRGLPEKALELPVLAVSTALQVSLRAQQRYAALTVRGDELLTQLRGGAPDEPPAWATFDDEAATSADADVTASAGTAASSAAATAPAEAAVAAKVATAAKVGTAAKLATAAKSGPAKKTSKPTGTKATAKKLSGAKSSPAVAADTNGIGPAPVAGAPTRTVRVDDEFVEDELPEIPGSLSSLRPKPGGHSS